MRVCSSLLVPSLGGYLLHLILGGSGDGRGGGRGGPDARLEGASEAGAGGVRASKLVAFPPTELRTTDVYGGADADVLKHPADWSRGVPTLPAHSHNDYWRDTPVLEALSKGVTSVESDVWLNPDDGRLYVGHDPFSLSPSRTFQSITVEPLLRAVEQANVANHLYSDSDEARFFKSLQRKLMAEYPDADEEPRWNGFWSAGEGATTPITLLVDVKTDGQETWAAVVRELEPLRRRGYLARWEDGKVVAGPVKVVGTGGTPVDQLANLTRRDYFLDCPLGKLSPRSGGGTTTTTTYNASLCGVASTDLASLTTWKGLVEPAPEAARKNLSDAIEEAHALGIKTRVWETPTWPVYARDAVNRLLLELGSDYINADDLDALLKF